MSQDQIQLPDYDELCDCGANFYYATTVRRLIAEAVSAEREACALACDEAKAQSRNHLFRSGLSIAAGAIRARGDKT